jgi:hypothetical protein
VRRGSNLTQTPPDLSQLFTTEAERSEAREALLLYWHAIELLLRLADQPASQWSDQQRSLFPHSVPGGPSEPPQDRLQRWLTVYGDEIKTIRDVRNRVVHRGIVTDPELRGAVYIARHVISSAMGVSPSQAEPAWASNYLDQAS